jgi:hypothetical protein
MNSEERRRAAHLEARPFPPGATGAAAIRLVPVLGVALSGVGIARPNPYLRDL